MQLIILTMIHKIFFRSKFALQSLLKHAHRIRFISPVEILVKRLVINQTDLYFAKCHAILVASALVASLEIQTTIALSLLIAQWTWIDSNSKMIAVPRFRKFLAKQRSFHKNKLVDIFRADKKILLSQVFQFIKNKVLAFRKPLSYQLKIRYTFLSIYFETLTEKV